jgi:hypothetical protein
MTPTMLDAMMTMPLSQIGNYGETPLLQTGSRGLPIRLDLLSKPPAAMLSVRAPESQSLSMLSAQAAENQSLPQLINQGGPKSEPNSLQ